MSFRMTSLAAAVTLVVSAGSSGADTIFQSVPDFNAASTGVYGSDVSNHGLQLFDTFSLASDASIARAWFNVQTAYFDPTAKSVTLSVWSISGGLPNSELFSTILTPMDYQTVMVDPYVTTLEVPLAGLSLSAGTYDISFYNPNLLGVPVYSGGAGLAYWSGPNANFFVGSSAAFALCTAGSCDLSYPPAVPEPETWVMVLLGFGSLGFVSWRASRRRAGRATQ